MYTKTSLHKVPLEKAYNLELKNTEGNVIVQFQKLPQICFN